MRLILLALCLTTFAFADTPKIVVFDFGGVVARVDRKPMLHFLSDTLGIPYKKIRQDLRHDKLYVALEKPTSYWEKYAKKSLSNDWTLAYEAEKKKIVQKIPGIDSVITKLKSEGIQVALLSNTKFERARFIEKQGGYEAFDPILLSCHLGTKKPEPKIYNKLLDHLSWDASQCLFIDNSAKNIEAAKKLGIDGIIFDSTEQLIEELQHHDLLTP